MQLVTANRRMSLTPESIWLCFIIALGGALRLYGLDFQSMWFDEGLQYYVATNKSLDELFHQTNSFHPPLSFIINYLFLLPGESDFLLRLPSALFGIASLPLFYILARELSSEREAVIAVLILAISPFHIWYSQEGRMYSQLLFFSLLSSVLLLQAIKNGNARGWVYYALSSAAGIYTHAFMAPVLLGHFLWVVARERRFWPAMTASGIAVTILFLPWALLLPWVNRFMGGVAGVIGSGMPSNMSIQSSVGRAGFSWGAIPYTLFAYGAGFSLGPSVTELHNNRSLDFILLFLPSITIVTALFAPLLCIGTVLLYKHYGTKQFTFSLIGLVLPLFLALAYALVPHATFNARYTLTAFPFFCLFVGTGLAHSIHAKKIVGVTLLMGVMTVSFASTYNYFTNPRYAKEDVRSAVGYWRATSQNEPLLTTFRAKYTTDAYLQPAEAKRHFSVGVRDLISSIQSVLSSQAKSSAYVLLARDWNRVQEKAIRNSFAVTQEANFPGVTILRVAQRRIPDRLDSVERLRAAG
jgi:uncharacterized membrane protein